MKYQADGRVMRATRNAVAAIMFECILSSVRDAAAMREKRKYKRGRYWTHATLEGWVQFFQGSFGVSTIRTAITKLRTAGLVDVDHFDRLEMKNTTWYTISREGLTLVGEDFE